MKKIALSLFVLAASGGYVWSQAASTSTETALNVNGGDAGNAVVSLVGPNTTLLAVPDAGAADAAPALTLKPAPKIAATVNVAPPVAEPAQVAVATPAPAPAAATPSPDLQISQLLADPAPVVPAPRPTDQAFNTRQSADTTTAVTADAAPVPAATPAQTPGAFVDGSYTGTAANAYYGLVQVQANVQGGKLASVKVLQYPNDRRTSRYINSQALPILQREAISAQDANVDTVSGATLSSDAFINSLGSALKQARTGVVRS
jgi:uncharacterized protein with FMN-binding domain